MNTAYLINQLFSQGMDNRKQKHTPAYNTRTTETGIELALAVPGYAKEVFSISVEDAQLKIAAKVLEEEKEVKYYQKGIANGSFEVTYRLSSKLDAEGIKARHEDGVLYISIDKKEIQSHKVSIA